MRRQFANLLRALLFLTSLAACQTSPLKDFDQVTQGMEKQDVLELMGSPKRTQRFHGKDRWTYVFYDNHIRFEKEIHFFEGNAVYVGNIWEPPQELSAAVIDKQNDEKNKSLDAQMAKEIASARNAYHQYESNIKGEGEIRYIPRFEPIR